jgi:hypothetical protein
MAMTEDEIREALKKCQKPAGFSKGSATLVPAAPVQKEVLTQYLRWRKSPPSIARLFRRSVRNHLRMVLVGVGGAWLSFAIGTGIGAIVIRGELGGVLLRDIAWFRVMARTWPTLAAVLDWERVEQLLEDESVTLGALRSGSEGIKAADSGPRG